MRRQLDLASSAPSVASTSYAASSVAGGAKRPSSVTSASTTSSNRKRPRLNRSGSSASAKPAVTFALAPAAPQRPASPSESSDDEHLWTYPPIIPPPPTLSVGQMGLVPCGLCVNAADGDCMCASFLTHDNLPAPAQPTPAEVAAVTTLASGAVPLRRVKAGTEVKSKVWDFQRAPAVEAPTVWTGPLAMCTGDSRTCPACSDDAYVGNDAAHADGTASARRSVRRCLPTSARPTRAQAAQDRARASASCPWLPSRRRATTRIRRTRPSRRPSRAPRHGASSKPIRTLSSACADPRR